MTLHPDGSLYSARGRYLGFVRINFRGRYQTAPFVDFSTLEAAARALGVTDCCELGNCGA